MITVFCAPPDSQRRQTSSMFKLSSSDWKSGPCLDSQALLMPSSAVLNLDVTNVMDVHEKCTADMSRTRDMSFAATDPRLGHGRKSLLQCLRSMSAHLPSQRDFFRCRYTDAPDGRDTTPQVCQKRPGRSDQADL
jgi:hypothetical protein